VEHRTGGKAAQGLKDLSGTLDAGGAAGETGQVPAKRQSKYMREVKTC